MKTTAKLLTAALLLVVTASALADVHYVDVNSTNATPPYTNWSTAATKIQDAVDAAVAGDEIVVTNGSYAPLSIGKPLSVRSVNGPQFTSIDGGGGARCATLINGASLSGFTLTNGSSFTYGGGGGGGGVWCEGTNAVVSNCVIIGNQTSATYDDYPPFRFARGGGAYGGTLNHCTLTGNSIIVNEFSDFAIIYAYGGGAYASTLNNCKLTANSVEANIGHIASAVAGGGGAAYCALNNCVLSGNRAASSAPLGAVPGPNTYGGGAYDCTLNNCTLTGNRGGGASSSTLNNCINFRNGPGVLEGNNWFGDPLFVDTNGWANLRLQSNSPCINAGDNAYTPAGPDLDGNPRIVGGTVDIGAYEFQSLDSLNFGVVSNQFGFNITGQSNWVIVLEASSDFANWIPLTTNTLSGSPFPFHDPTPSKLPHRFYRARLQ